MSPEQTKIDKIIEGEYTRMEEKRREEKIIEDDYTRIEQKTI